LNCGGIAGELRLHKASKHRRRDGDEGMRLALGQGFKQPTGAQERNANAPQAQVYQLHQHKHLVAFRPQKNGSEGLGYSDSVVQFVGLTPLRAGHHTQLSGDLRAMRQGGIDLLAGLSVGVWTKLQPNQPLTASR
jgi:hypothetical protein